MHTGRIEARLLNATLQEVTAFREQNDLDVIFQSNGWLNSAGKPEATIRVGSDEQRIIAAGKFPAWVEELTSDRADLSGLHFRITLSGSSSDSYRLEIVEEMLERLIDCDIYRDGGSFGASWITSYGAIWELFLRTSDTGVGDPDRSRRHTYLYNTGANSSAPKRAVLKGTDEEATIMKLLNDWLDRPVAQLQINREVMRRYSRLESMYNSISWRMY